MLLKSYFFTMHIKLENSENENLTLEKINTAWEIINIYLSVFYIYQIQKTYILNTKNIYTYI